MRQKVSKYTWLRKCRSISCIVRIRSLLHKVQITLPRFHHFPSPHVHFRCRLANKLAAKSCLTWLMEYLTYSYVITEPSSFNHVLHHSRRHPTCQWWSCWKFRPRTKLKITKVDLHAYYIWYLWKCLISYASYASTNL